MLVDKFKIKEIITCIIINYYYYYYYFIIIILSFKVMVTNVTSLLKTVKTVEDEAARGSQALESSIQIIGQELKVLCSFKF